MATTKSNIKGTTTKKKATTKKKKPEKFTIYSIWHRDTCMYVGCTQRSDVEVRWDEHKKDLANGKHKTKKLQEMYDKNNGDFTYQVEMEIYSDSTFLMFICEGLVNSFRVPKANCIVIKKGRMNTRLGRTPQDLAKLLIDVVCEYYNKK